MASLSRTLQSEQKEINDYRVEKKDKEEKINILKIRSMHKRKEQKEMGISKENEYHYYC